MRSSFLLVIAFLLHDFSLVGAPNIRAWGSNSFGQCDVPVSLTNAVRVACGHYHSLALRDDGTVVAWGANNWAGSGQCDVPGGLSNAVDIAAGEAHSLALTSDGRIVAWGTIWAMPIQVPPDLTNVAALSSGEWHCVALKRDGTVAAFGNNMSGQCNVPAGLTNVVAIAGGDQYSLAVRADGTLVAWGNYLGSCPDPSYISDVAVLSANGSHVLTINSRHELLATGANDYGQSSPVPPNVTNVTSVAAGMYHSLARRADGAVIAWGRNTDGQCNVPVDLPIASQISAGLSHNLALINVSNQPTLQIKVNATNVVLTFPTISNQVYQIQCNTNLTSGAWNSLGSPVAGSGALLSVTNMIGPEAESFFRLLIQQR